MTDQDPTAWTDYGYDTAGEAPEPDDVPEDELGPPDPDDDVDQDD